MGRMKKREAIAIIEATLRQQAATGTVSSKLVEQLVTIRGWSGKAKAARAKARAAAIQPPVAEVPLPELIAQAKEPQVSQPAPGPVPQTPVAAPPSAPRLEAAKPPVLRGALDLLCGITEEPPSQPAPAAPPRPQAPLTQVCPVSHFDFADRVVIADGHHAPPENGGDGLYW